MLDTDVKLECLEDDERLCNKVTEILLVLTKAEKQGQNLYTPLKQIEGILNDLQDENLLTLYQRLLYGFQLQLHMNKFGLTIILRSSYDFVIFLTILERKSIKMT